MLIGFMIQFLYTLILLYTIDYKQKGVKIRI